MKILFIAAAIILVLLALTAFIGLGAGFVFLVMLLPVVVLCGFKPIPQNQLAIVRAWGMYQRTVGPPCAWVIPGIEQITLFDSRGQIVNLHMPMVHTRDRIPLILSVRMLARFDPRGIRDKDTSASLTSYLPKMFVFEGIIRQRTEHLIRELVGGKTWREVCTPAGRAELEAGLTEQLGPQLRGLGIYLSHHGGVLLGPIELPQDVQQAAQGETMLRQIADAFGCDEDAAGKLLAILGMARGNGMNTVVDASALIRNEGEPPPQRARGRIIQGPFDRAA